MDNWLATVYGTNGGAADDLEKIAQAEMAQQMAQQEGIDLNGLSEEQVAMLGQEVLGQGAPQGGAQQQPGQGQQPQFAGQQPGAQQGGQESGIDPSQITEEVYAQAQQILEAAQQGQQLDPAMIQEAQAIMQVVEQMQAQQGGGQPSPEMAKVAEAQAKFEEADFLGRVMAHSFNQESEKIAASKVAMNVHMGDVAHGLAGAAKEHAGNAVGAIKHHGGKALSHVKGHPAAYAAGAAGAAGLGAGVAAGHHMAKQAAIGAIEKAAMQQAANILQQSGINPATGQPMQQQPTPQAPSIAPAGGVQQQNPGAQAALGDLVEKRAHQILRGLGYRVG